MARAIVDRVEILDVDLCNTPVMKRASLWVGLLLATEGCFEDPEPACPQGSESCPCLNLQCEAGLVCQQAKCVAASSGTGSDGTETGTTSPGPDAGSSTSEAGESATTDASTTTAPTSGDTTASADSSTGEASVCGDGLRDPDEACDSTPGCNDACELVNYDCNPLNNVPCPAGYKCSVVEPAKGTVAARCLPFADPPPGQLHEYNCFFEFDRHDEWCDVGLACALSNWTPACVENCCVEFCDLTDPTFECAWKGDTCQPFFAPTVPSGLEFLGFCVAP